MPRPPEHIRIKRRREDEPVETLYFQTPQGHDPKRRRFTDFVFQRILREEERQPLFGGPTKRVEQFSQNGQVGGHQPATSVSSSATNATSRLSSGQQAAPATGNRGVPLVKATAPGDENRSKKPPGPLPSESRASATAPSKQYDESSPAYSLMYPSASPSLPQSDSSAIASSSTPSDGDTNRNPGGTNSTMQSPVTKTPAQHPVPSSTSNPLPAIRRFKLSRPIHGLKNTNAHNAANVPGLPGRKGGLLENADGAQKRDRNITPAVLVENFEQTTGDFRQGLASQSPVPGSEAIKKRRVHDEGIDVVVTNTPARETPTELPSLKGDRIEDRESVAKPKLKHLPKPQNSNAHKARSSNILSSTEKRDDIVSSKTDNTEHDDQMQDEDDYIYDEFIRRPVYEVEPELQFPLFQTGRDAGDVATANNAPLPRNIGLLSITEDDVEYWEEYLDDSRDSDENWYSEDEDSNAEDNPANDYPDEPQHTYDSDDSEGPVMSDGDEDYFSKITRYGDDYDDDDDEDYLPTDAPFTGSVGPASDDEDLLDRLQSNAQYDSLWR